MAKIGTAYVDVEADFSKFDREVNRRVAALQSKFGAVGGTAGDDFARSFAKGVGSSSPLAGLEREIERSGEKIKRTGTETGKGFSSGVDKGMSDSGRSVTAFERTANAALKGVSSSARAAADEVSGIAKAQDDVVDSGRRVAAVDLARQQATLNLVKAEEALVEVTKKSDATVPQRQQAALNVAKAQHAIAEADHAATRAHRDQETAAGNLARALSSVEGETQKGQRGFQRLVAAFSGGGGGFSKAARGLGDFGGASNGATATLGGLRIALAALIPLAIGFGGATVSVVSALGPLIGLAAAAGGALLVAAQGFGVFKLATSGITEALKEQTTKHLAAGGAATGNAAAQRGAARAIQSAQDGVRSATQALADAHRTQREAVDALAPAYTAARVRLRDLRDAAIDAGFALKDANRATSETRKALADLLAGPSPRALADAHRGVTDALRGEGDAAQTLADAFKDLNDLLAVPSPRVMADAHRRVTDALRGEDSAAQSLADAHRALNELLAPAAALDVAEASDNVADAVRGEERARLSLNKQIAETQKILADPRSSEDAKAQARLGLADAENAVGDAARETTRSKERLAKLEAAPDQNVVAAARLRVGDAESAVATAALGTVDARDALAKLEAGPDQVVVAAARRRVGDAESAVAEAALSTVDARDALAKLETPATARQIADARTVVAEAEQRVAEAIRDQARAVRELDAVEAKGISRSQEVVAARDAIRVADQGVAEAGRNVQRSTQALADAQLSANESMAAGAAAAANLNTAMDSLSPPAQAFVRTLLALKPKLDELKAAAAAGFFPGATAGLSGAMGSFEAVKKVVAETAIVLGEFARKTGEMVGSKAFSKDIETIGGRNAKVLDTMGEAVRHVITAIRNMLVESGPLTQWLADVANGWSLQAASATKAGRESGKLAGFFDKTRAVLERLGSIIGHTASGLLGVGRAGTSSGNDILASIDRASARFDRWANSVKGQSALKDFFERTKELAAALMPVLGGITSALGILVLKTLPLTTVLGVLGPYADEATLAFVGYKLAVIAAGIASKTAAAAQWLLNAALTANPIGVVVVALAALAAGIIYAYKHCETFRNIVDTSFNWIKDNWPLLLGILTGPIGLAVVAITSHWSDLVTFFKGLPAKFVNALKAAPGLLVDAGKWMLNRIVDGFKTVTDALGSVAGWLKNRLVDLIEGQVDALKGAGSWIVNRVVDGFKTVTSSLQGAGGWIKNRFVDFIQAEAQGITAIGSWIVNKVVDGFKTVTDALSGVGGWLKNRISDFITGTKDGFLDVGGSIVGWIVDGMKGGLNLLIGFVNKIIWIINKIPNVDIQPIPEVKAHARGGVVSADSVPGFATGGTLGSGPTVHHDVFAKGGRIARPMVVVGEEAPRHDEYVIPTNPAYRGRAMGLHADLSRALGIPGFAVGGVLGSGLGVGAGMVDQIFGFLKNGASDLIGKLPGVGSLPNWLEGTGKFALSKASSFITNQIKSIVDGDGGALEPAIRILRMVKKMNEIDAKGYPYSYGGGHNGSFAPSGDIRGGGAFGYDCSGLVSAILHAGGFASGPMSTDPLKVWGESGDGKAITVGVRGTSGLQAHTMMRIGNKFLESGSGHGAQWVNGWSGNFPIHRHPKGFAMGGIVDRLFDPRDPDFLGWGLAQGGTLPFVGSYKDGGVVPRDGMAYVHQGETITPEAAPVPSFRVFIGSRELMDIVRVEIDESDRQKSALFRAGVSV